VKRLILGRHVFLLQDLLKRVDLVADLCQRVVLHGRASLVAHLCRRVVLHGRVDLVAHLCRRVVLHGRASLVHQVRQHLQQDMYLYQVYLILQVYHPLLEFLLQGQHLLLLLRLQELLNPRLYLILHLQLQWLLNPRQ